MAPRDKIDDQMTMVEGHAPADSAPSNVGHDDAATLVPDSGASFSASDEDPGERFQIVDEVGRGGMGVVYKARDRKLGRIVALKCLKPESVENQRTIERFWREAKAIATLNHFNITQIYNVLEKDRGLWIEMEFVSGGSLRQKLEKTGPLPVDEVVDLGLQLCDALAQAHEKNICHRDIKPGNILLTERGTPKLGDFGLARDMEGDADMTAVGTMMGTLFFAAPEQMASGTNVDARSDIYGLGATLYTAATGQIPRSIRLDRVPEKIREIIGKCLEEHPDRRFQSAEELAEELAECQDKAPKKIVSHTCPQCGHGNPESVRFCQKCGAGLSKLFQNCPKCGSDNPLQSEFCGSCGENIQMANLVRQAQEAWANAQPKKASKIFRQVLASDPKNTAAQEGLERIEENLALIRDLSAKARTAAKMGDKEEVYFCCHKIRELDPSNREAQQHCESLLPEVIQQRLIRAKTAMSLKKYQRCHELLEGILELEQDNVDALQMMSNLAKFYKPAMELKQPQEAPMVSMNLSGGSLNKNVARIIAVGFVALVLISLIIFSGTEDEQIAAGPQSSMNAADREASDTAWNAGVAATRYISNNPGKKVTMNALIQEGFVAPEKVMVFVTRADPKDLEIRVAHKSGIFVFVVGPKGQVSFEDKEPVDEK